MTENLHSPPRQRNRWIPLAVLAAFVAPILAAWWFAILHPEAVPPNQLNHGQLIHPPIDLSAPPAGAALAEFKLAPAEWGLVYFGAGPCTQECASRVELLATIRGLLGAQGARVHVAALVDSAPTTAIAQALTIVDTGARSLLAREAAARSGSMRENGIVIVDSQHLAMMIFPADAPPADIKEDLKRLLRGSAIN
jgi:hypothetical protein